MSVYLSTLTTLRTARVRLIWVCPVAVMASWLAVRTLGASPDLRPPPAAATSQEVPEIRDVALAQMIGRFADAARAGQQPAR